MAMAAMAEAAAAAMEAEAGDKKREGNLVQRLESAITARAEYIKDHAETLTMQSFRRLIEQDLGMESSALDPHKKKIKELVDRILNNDDQTPQVSECAIREALAKRRSYLQKESRTSDSQQIMRLLEEDMGLRNLSLDTEKDLVKPILNEFLSTLDDSKEDVPSTEVEAVETTTEENEKLPKRKLESNEKPRQKRKLVKKLEESDESDREDVEEHKHDNDSKSKLVMRKALANQLEESDSEHLVEHKPENISKEKANKKKAREGEDLEKLEKVSKSKSSKKKPVKKLDEPDADDSEDLTPDAESPRKSSKKAAKSDSKPVQSKLAEKLKQMIKACGMNVPPSLYKRVKEVPESSREKTLIKELESLLQKERLDRNSSDKELKAVKRKKDKQKDLEGIDASNIITQGRGRRQANNFYDLPSPVEKKKKKAIVSEDEDSDGDKPKTSK